MTIVCLHLAVAVAAPMIAPQDPAVQDAGAMLQSPSWAHWFGTDRLGRDVFSRTLLGGREAMLIATLATVIAMVWGSALGILARHPENRVLVRIKGQWPPMVAQIGRQNLEIAEGTLRDHKPKSHQPARRVIDDTD
jgi:hypothetical protein